jgi:hypothetical protein
MSAMNSSGPLGGKRAAGVGVSLVLLSGCGLFADIGDLEYGSGGAAATSTTPSSTGPGIPASSSTESSSSSGAGGEGANGAGGDTSTSTTTTTTSSSSDGGGGAGQTGSGGEGGVLDPGEQCGNGVDDDDDDLVDCEDDECTGEGWSCVEYPSGQGFGGTVAYAYGTPDDPPECAPGWTEIARGGIGAVTASPAECTACSCDAATGGTCNATLNGYNLDASCTTLSNQITVSGNGATCGDVGDFAVASLLGVNNESVTGASCPASGGVPTVPEDAEFETPLVVCEMPAGGGCATGVCTPMPAAPFEPTRCVYKTSGGNCNFVDPFTERVQIDTAISDSRGCGTCSCINLTGRTCTASTTVYAQDNCLGGSTSVAHDGGCVAASQTVASYMVEPIFTGGTCSPSGGAPTGGVVGTDEWTLCCQP